jgi:hypothetical protein
MIWIIPYAIALVLSAAMAVSPISFALVMFSFGLIYLIFLAVGFVALLGPLAVAIYAVMARLGRASWENLWAMVNVWVCALIVHVGTSYGQSHWGDVGGTMGAKNMPYVESFLSPFIFIANRM